MVFTNVGIEQLRRALRDDSCVGGTEIDTPRTLSLVLAEHVGHLTLMIQHQHALVADATDACRSDQQLLVKLSHVLLHLVLLADSCGVDLGKGALQQLSDKDAKWRSCAGAASNPVRLQQQLQHQSTDISSTSSKAQDTEDQGYRACYTRSWSTQPHQLQQQQQRPLVSMVEDRNTNSGSDSSSSTDHGQQDTRSSSASLQSLTPAPAAVAALGKNSRGSSSVLLRHDATIPHIMGCGLRALSAPDLPPPTPSSAGLHQLRGCSSHLISTEDTVVKPVSRPTASLLLQLAHKDDSTRSSSSTAATADGSGGGSTGSGNGCWGDALRLPNDSSSVHVMQFTTGRETQESGGGGSLATSAGLVRVTNDSAPAAQPAAIISAVRSLWSPTALQSTHSSNSDSSSNGPFVQYIDTSTLSSESRSNNNSSLCCQSNFAAVSACGTSSSAMMYNTPLVSSTTNSLLQNLLMSRGDSILGAGLGSSAAGGLLPDVTDPAVALPPTSALITPTRLAPLPSIASPYLTCSSRSSSTESLGLYPTCNLAVAAAARSAAGVPVSGTLSTGNTARCLNLGTVPASSVVSRLVHSGIDLVAVTEATAVDALAMAPCCPRCGLLHTGKCPHKAKCVRCYRKAHLGECWTRCISCNLVHAPGKCKTLQTRQH